MSNRARPNGATDPPLTSDRQSSNGSPNGTPASGHSDRESKGPSFEPRPGESRPQFSGQQMPNPARPQSASRPPFSDLPGASDRPGPTGRPGSTYPPGRTPPIIPPRAPEPPASSSSTASSTASSGSSAADQLTKGLSAARQAMREKTAAMMDAAAQASESRARQREARVAERRAAQQRTDDQYAAQLRAAQNSSPGMPPGSPSGFPGGPPSRPIGVPGTPAETIGLPRTNPPSALSTPPAHRAAAQPTYGRSQPPAKKSPARGTHRPAHRTRKARLRLARVDPWSVMKTAFLLSIAFGIVTWVMVFIVWSAIGAAGVFDNINSTVQEVLGTPGADPFRIQDYISTNKVMGFTTLLACADVLIITALATLGGFLYNIAASLLGGLEVTLASEE
jgi:Transmembrane domain of unknown function (DUF3566)